MKSEEKIKNLKKMIAEMERVLIAFSGGVDSTFLLKICVDILGKENVIAVTASSPTHQMDEMEEAKKIAQFFGVKHVIIHTDEMENEAFVTNPVERCYFCKKELFSKLKEIAAEYGIKYVLDASNGDDAFDYRPGMKAARELGIKSPLLEAGITKEEIRKFSKEMGLPTATKPSQACLASRFPYGEKITEEKLKMVAEAEKFLKELGFKVVRVRHHGKIARIEVDKNEIARIMEEGIRKKIYERLKEIGYTWVCLDLMGYRSGSMNEAINGGTE
ncbi:MAG: ATP-dependent sacrificial sulfur transferase LarE [Thermoplasmata archaeon]|nr:ATP-dependent sacrificial sulfur transferase LarE [Thermoplasmata archaeon]